MWIAIQNAVGQRVGGGPGPTPPPYTPPLDANPATAAYSVRKLSSSYSGSAIEAYRVSDGATQDIGFDGDGLLNTADIISFASGGEVRVRTWYDQTSNGYDAVGVSTGEYPVIYDGSSLITDGANPALKFISTNNSGLQITPNIVLSGNLLIVALANTNRASGANHKTIFYANTNYSTVGAGITDVGGTGIELTQGWSSPPNNVGNTATEAARASLGFPHIRAFSVVSSVPSMNSDGVTGTDTSSWTPFTETFIGRRSDGAFDYLGVMQEIMVWDTAQASIIPTLESNLNSYYQVANLPDYTSGFLADYPDAAAAYSVRKLSNTAIKCMRVRRAVAPFDEQDIGFTAGGDLDEAAIVAFGGSDVLVVSAWYDQSGQSNHATQITPVNQPQIYDGTAVTTLNGKPSVTFSGATFMTYTTWSPSSELSAFWVAQNEATTSSWTLIGPNNNQWAPISTSQFRTRINGFYTWAWSVASGAQYLAALIRDVNDDAEFHYNGNTSSTTRNFTDTVTLNALSNSSNGLDGGIQEVVFWSADQSSNRTAIETNISDYYEIIVNDEAATSGFLFDYPNAAVAYSVRQLNNNATYSMRVERSDGRTLNIGFDGNGDLDTQAIIDFAGASVATVRRWFDQTGNQNHAGLSQNPVIIYDGTSIISRSGIPAVQNGTNVGHMNFSPISIPASGGYTTFAAKGSQSNWGGVITGGWYPRSSTQGWIVSGNATIDSFSAANLFDEMVMTSRKDGNDYDMWRNTTSLYSNTLGTAYVGGPFQDLFRGEQGDPNSVVDDGLLHEAIFYDSALPDATVTNIQNNLITQYSL